MQQIVKQCQILKYPKTEKSIKGEWFLWSASEGLHFSRRAHHHRWDPTGHLHRWSWMSSLSLKCFPSEISKTPRPKECPICLPFREKDRKVRGMGISRFSLLPNLQEKMLLTLYYSYFSQFQSSICPPFPRNFTCRAYRSDLLSLVLNLSKPSPTASTSSKGADFCSALGSKDDAISKARGTFCLVFKGGHRPHLLRENVTLYMCIYLNK